MPCVVGITAEFNPFHEGHRYLIDKTASALRPEAVVSVMSGDFVQRGGPACFDKWTRAVQAVKGGIDLVVELPAVFAVSSADDFARGAVTVLKGLGVDTIAFGSEAGSAVTLAEAAGVLADAENMRRNEIKTELSKGISYPAAMMNVIKRFRPDLDEDLFTLPNNLLALQYIKNARGLDFFTITRTESYRASEIRAKMQLDTDRISEAERRYFELIRYTVLRTNTREIENTASAGEGLANRLKSEIRAASSVDDLIGRVKSKRYTHTRIGRLLTQMLLGITRESIDDAVGYIRPLAFNDKGAVLLRHIRNGGACTLPFVDSAAKVIKAAGPLARTLSFDVLASDLYALITDGDLYSDSDYIMKPISVKTNNAN